MAEKFPNDDLDDITTTSSHGYASDDDLSHFSMSSKLSASHALYSTELKNAQIFGYHPASTFQPPIDLKPMLEFLREDRETIPGPARKSIFHTSMQGVGNEDEMMQIILPQLIDIIWYFCHGVFSMRFNRPWLFQNIFSERLGHPQPDVTCGLTEESVRQLYPSIFDPRDDLFRALQPLKGTILPTLFFEAKGPRGSMSEAGLQNQHNGACALKNILAVKLALNAKPEDFILRVLALGIKFTTESIRATCYWIDRKTPLGPFEYWSADILDPVSLENFEGAQKLVRNVIAWTRLNGQAALMKDLRLLEELKRPKRKRDRSPEWGAIAGPVEKKKRIA